jgi:hypothetical protein
MIAGVDAGKLRACFAAAFAEEPSERPSTAAEFVASFQDAISNKRVTDEPAPSVVAVPVLSDECEFLSEKRDDPPCRSRGRHEARRRWAARKPAAQKSEPQKSEPQKPEPQKPAAQKPAAQKPRLSSWRLANRPAPEPATLKPPSRPQRVVTDVALFEEVTPPRARSIVKTSYPVPAQTSYPVPVHSGTRAFLVTAVVVVSFAAGFGGGFVVGHFSRPSPESIDVSHHESVAEPPPTRVAVEEPKPIASTSKTGAPIADEKVPRSEPIAATVAPRPVAPFRGVWPSSRPLDTGRCCRNG